MVNLYQSQRNSLVIIEQVYMSFSIADTETMFFIGDKITQPAQIQARDVLIMES
jgi:hypothetical protein